MLLASTYLFIFLGITEDLLSFIFVLQTTENVLDRKRESLVLLLQTYEINY